MAESHVVSGLRAKREEIQKRIADLEKQLPAGKISAISGALRVFGEAQGHAKPDRLFGRGERATGVFS
jgi:hypothetical protein